MSVTVVVTNLSDERLSLTELQVTLGESGAINDSIEFTRSVSELDRMDELKSMVDAGTASVAMTAGSDNIDILSIPLEQHGEELMAVSVTGVVTADITFGSEFAAAPKVYLSAAQNTSQTTWRGTCYLRDPAVDGFTAVLDVTTAEAVTTSENPTFAPAEGADSTTVTTTLAEVPVKAGAITIDWAEAHQAIGTLTATGAQFGDADTVLLGSVTYTIQSVLVDAPNNVLLGVNDAATLANLVAAIMGATGEGVTYGTGTTANPDAGASVTSPTTMRAYALVGGVAGNSLDSVVTGSLASFATATLLGGTAATAAQATLTGTSTIGGAQAARLSAATINRTTGALSLTFAAKTIGTNNGPNADSIRVSYIQDTFASVQWIAVY